MTGVDQKFQHEVVADIQWLIVVVFFPNLLEPLADVILKEMKTVSLELLLKQHLRLKLLNGSG